MSRPSRPALLALAAVLLLPGARLPAQTANDDMTTSWRVLDLGLLERQASEAAEREAARARRTRLSAATYDRNHDGKLDEQEFAAWEKAVRTEFEASPRAMKKYDRNHNRKLDDAEWAVARRELLGDR